MTIRALAIISCLALPAAALAGPDKAGGTADTTKPMTDKAGKLSDADSKIVAHVHHVNQMEIDLAKAAQKNGTATVKNYAETLERDHQSADKDLMAFAKQHKLATIPADKPETDADKQDVKTMMADAAKLKTLKGPEFDKEFLNMMVMGHDKEIAKVDAAAGSATDPDLQAMLKTIKPVMQRHSDQARDLQKNVQTSSAAPAPTAPGSPTPVTPPDKTTNTTSPKSTSPDTTSPNTPAPSDPNRPQDSTLPSQR